MPLRRWCRIGLVVALMAAGLVFAPADPAGAAVISNPDGPLTRIEIGTRLNCAVSHIEDTQPEWYGTNACATLVSLNGTLFGPSSIPAGSGATGVVGFTPYTLGSQSAVSGSGTAADPFTIVTVVGAGPGATLTQTDTYVVGNEFYDTSVTVTNTSGLQQTGTIYTAGDCYLQNSDYGYGRIVGTAPACVASTALDSRIEQLLPRTGGNSYYQAQYSQVWSRIGSQLAFPNTCRCNEHIDNGIGISWPLNLAAGGSATWEWSTVFSPSGDVPLIVTATAHAPTSRPLEPNGYRIEVSNGNAEAATADTITVVLPDGFVYTPGSTTGVTTADPAIDGQTLTWTGPFAISPGGVVTIDFNVTVASEPGTYTIDASATSDLDVTPANDAAPIIVQQESDLSVTKTASVDTAVAGGTAFTYAIVATNNGPSSAPGVFVTDTLPAGFTFDAATSSADCFTIGQAVRCNIGTLASGASATVTVGVTVASAATVGAKSNLAVVSGDVDDPTPGNDSASDAVTVSRVSDVSMTKTASSPTVDAGGTVTFTMVVANAGPSTSGTITFADVLPVGLTATSITGSGCSLSTLRCSFTLAANASTTITLVATADPDLAEGTVLTNQATVTTPNDPDDTNNSASVDVTVTRSADLSVAKTTGPDGLRAGSIGVYKIEVTNSGPSSANDVTLTDTLPDGLTFNPDASSAGCTAAGLTVMCDIGTVPPGETAIVEIAVDVASSVPAGTELTDTATVAATEDDPNGGNNTATVTDTVARVVDLVLSKVGSPPTVNAGETVTYTVTATNNGPSDASDVVISDPLPAEIIDAAATVTVGTGTCTVAGTVTCTFDAVAAGETVAVEITGTVDPATAPGVITDTATVASAEEELEPGDNDATAETNVAATTGLVVSKAASTPAVAGAPFTYTVTVGNQGPSTSTGVALTDTLPAGFTATSATASNGSTCTIAAGTVSCPDLGTLAPGSEVVVTVTGVPDATLASGTPLANTATATDAQGGEATTSTTTDVVRQANVTVTKTPLTDPVVAGAEAQWQIQVANSGPSAAGGVVVVEAPDPGFTVSALDGADCDVSTLHCTVGDIAPGDTVTITVTATVAPDLPAGTLTNTATVTSPDTDPGDNSGSATVDVVQVADLTLEKVSVPPVVAAGENVSYEITVGNTGPSTATGVVVTDTLPGGLTFVTDGTTAGCTPAGQVITCDVGSLGPGESQLLVITATTDLGLDAVVLDLASADADQDDPTPATASTTVTPRADLSISKTTETAFAGSTMTWTITVSNAGPSTAVGAVVTDTLAPGLTFVSATVPGGSCEFASGTVTCTLGPIAAGGSAAITLVTAVPPDFVPTGQTATSVANAATVAFPGDPDPDDNTATVPGHVTGAARLVATKTVEPEPLVAGTDATYRITITNEGPSVATGIVVTDRLPLALTMVAAGTDPRCAATDPATNTVTCTEPGPLAVGATTVFIVVARVDPRLGDGSSIVDDASAEGAELDPDPAEDARAPSTVVRQFDLSIVKTASQTTVPAGGSFTYTLTITNNGPSVADNVVITDVTNSAALEGGAQFGVKGLPNCPDLGVSFACVIPQLLPGEGVTFTIPIRVAPGTPDGTIIRNVAVTNGDGTDVNLGNNRDEVVVRVSGRLGQPVPPDARDELPRTGVSYLSTLVAVGAGLVGLGVVCKLASRVVLRVRHAVP